ICFDDATFLNSQYTVVGEVVKGMEIVDKIKKGTADNNGSVTDPDVINAAYLYKLRKKWK
ncbi:MAG: peptidylprolyl isomerase, partial [Bartonella sp.]|nr:peptidylprolyl isomerase [Bartonella sp.]